MRIGKITVGALDEWSLNPGSVTSWHPTAAAKDKARQAKISAVPVSYMQSQHLRNYSERTAAGLNFSRQIIASCADPGVLTELLARTERVLALRTGAASVARGRPAEPGGGAEREAIG